MTLGKVTALLLALLTSCTGAVTVSPTVTAEEITATDAAGTAYVCEFDDSDRTFSGYDEADCTSIVFANGSVSVSGGGFGGMGGRPGFGGGTDFPGGGKGFGGQAG